MGCELAAPITSGAALRANVTNELGWNRTTRLLKNVTGLWLLEECNRLWSIDAVGTAAGAGIIELVEAAADIAGGVSVFDPDDPRLSTAADIPAAIRAICSETGQPQPSSPAEVARAILDSIALSFRRTVRAIEDVSGIRAEVIHLGGGGSLNVLLARLTASACGRPVHAGPAEATVIGNALVQAIADGELTDIAEGRRLVERSLPSLIYQPEPLYDWPALQARLSEGNRT